MTATQRLTVRVSAWDGGAWVRCSGVLVRDDMVLTAAHCVTDANGGDLPLAGMSVCTMENLDENLADGKAPACFDVEWMAVPNTWTGSNPYQLNKDYAVLWLDRGTGLGAMPITAQSDLAVTAAPDNHDGYPYRNPDCTFNLIDDDCLRSDNRYSARHLFAATGTVDAVMASHVRWDTSVAPATSGGPHYLCAGGDCSAPELTGIQAARIYSCPPLLPCVPDYVAGPKASAFKSFVTNITSTWPDADSCPAFGLEEFDFVAHAPGPPTAFDPAAFSPTCDIANPLAPGFGTSICDDIQVYVPPTGYPGGCTAQDKVVVFLPGTASGPEDNDYPMEYSAYAGFRTIGLSYGNAWDTATWCTSYNEVAGPASDLQMEVCHDVDGFPLQDYSDECPYWMRRERILGVEDPRSSYDPGWTFTDSDEEEEYQYLSGYVGLDANGDPILTGFPVEDSVLYRLLYALIRLDQADTQNICGWGDFYNLAGSGITTTGIGEQLEIIGVAGQMSVIDWDDVIVAGWSQGAGHAVWIDLHVQVAGLFMLDGPSDMCLTNPSLEGSGRGASYYAALVDSVLEPSGDAPRFGVYHVDSGRPTGAPDARPVAWDNYNFLDMGIRDDDPVAGLRMPMCDDQSWDATVAAAELSLGAGDPTGVPWLKRSPYPELPGLEAFLQISLDTDQLEPGSCAPHPSVAVSRRPGATLKSAIPGTPADCMPRTLGGPANTPEAAHLFEAYVQGFCALGEP